MTQLDLLTEVENALEGGLPLAASKLRQWIAGAAASSLPVAVNVGARILHGVVTGNLPDSGYFVLGGWQVPYVNVVEVKYQ